MTYDKGAATFLKTVTQSPPADGVYSESASAQILTPSRWRPTENDNQTMTALSREEIDAKLETIEVRMDGRVASIEAKIDGFMGRLEEKFGRMDDRMTHIEADISTARTEVKSMIGSLKTTTIVTAISAVLAIVLGVAAFNATVLSNMVASFESGKNTSAAQAEVKRQTEETAALLKQIQAQIKEKPLDKK